MNMIVVWLVLVVLLVIGEMATVGLTFIWFALGALAAAITAALSAALLVQWIVFLAVSALTLILVRPAAKKAFQNRISPTNADRIIGQVAQVTERIDNSAASGRVSIAGQSWSARSEHDVVISVGTQVKILRIEGVKVYVESV